MANRLADETSPYLLQHKDNPVDWYPWGDEAFERARTEEKPVFLSVGYSSCHWCHVMERESFEDPEIAALLNESFVSVKVDREARPDIDAIYMRAVQGMTGQGGWPMSVFLTPDGKPFFAGTYYPPRRQSGTPSFRDILAAVLEAYRGRRDDVAVAGEKVRAYLESQNRPSLGARTLTHDVLNKAYRTLAANFDAEHGGFGHEPKFPQPLVHEFLLRYWHRSGEVRAIAMAEVTANRMARGGIYDQLGGGFHRYATDPAWLIPHFEKMLYDNALLGALNLHLWQATGKDMFRRVTEETLGYVLREMTHPNGAFYSSQDADSDGEEGAFFVWEASEVDRLLGADLGRIARAYFGITDEGNFGRTARLGGRNVLSASRDDEEVAKGLEMPVEELRAAVQEARQRLLEARDKRPRPNTDDTAITSWNALMLKTFAEAGSALANREFVAVAERNAEFILGSLLRDGRLMHTWREGRANVEGYLEDYACLVDGLLTLYEATFDYRWVRRAVELAGQMIDTFWDEDEDEEAFFDTARDRKLLVRPRNVFDESNPSGGSTATLALLRLAVFTGEKEFKRLAVRSLRSVYGLMGSAPLAVPRWLAAVDFHLSKVKEIVVIGPRDESATQRLLGIVYDRYLPNKVVVGAESVEEEPSTPLLESRVPIDGRPTAFVCEDYHCEMPTTEPEGLAAQLGFRVRS